MAKFNEALGDGIRPLNRDGIAEAFQEFFILDDASIFEPGGCWNINFLKSCIEILESENDEGEPVPDCLEIDFKRLLFLHKGGREKWRTEFSAWRNMPEIIAIQNSLELKPLELSNGMMESHPGFHDFLYYFANLFYSFAEIESAKGNPLRFRHLASGEIYILGDYNGGMADFFPGEWKFHIQFQPFANSAWDD